MQTAQLRILLLKDGRPGHFRKSDGVARALARHGSVEIAEATLRRPFALPARLQRTLIRAPLPVALVVRPWGIDAHNLKPPDLIISSGAETLAPNALLARLFGCRNIFIGSVRGLPAEWFTAILTARPELAHLDRHFFVLSPSPVDPDALRRPLAFDSTTSLVGRTLALLIGGPTSGYRFAEADWEAIQALIKQSAELGAAWEITSSRRTPDIVASHFSGMAASLTRSVRFVDYRRQSFNSIDPLFNADAILVTEDSSTMISEAVAARRPVLVLRPTGVRKEASTLAPLLERKRVGLLPMRAATPGRVIEMIRCGQPLQENPLDTLLNTMRQAGVLTPGQ